MKTPFLVIRFILFALLGYHSVLAIALAAWNIASAKAAGVFVASGSILLIFNSCFFFLWMAIAVLEYLGQRKNAMASVVAYECAWAGVMSALELAAAIAVVLGGPPVYCHDRAPYQLCASSTILVPVSWFAGLLALSYFLVILSLSIGHMHSQPGLWQRSIYDVPWFDGDRVDKNPPRLPPVNRHESTRLSFLTRRHSVSGAPNDAGHTSVTDLNAQKYPEDQVANDPPPLTQRTNDNDPSRPWWSRYRTRPGVDLPFAVRFSTMIGRRNTRLSDDVPPQDIHRDMEARAGLELLDPFSRQYASFDLNERRQPKQSLPDSIGPLDMGSLDVDRPLPRPPRDEWVRADGSTASPRHKYDKRF